MLHSKKRSDITSEQKKENEKQKVMLEPIYSLSSSMLEKRLKDQEVELLDTMKVLRFNPEYSTMWNIRRDHYLKKFHLLDDIERALNKLQSLLSQNDLTIGTHTMSTRSLNNVTKQATCSNEQTLETNPTDPSCINSNRQEILTLQDDWKEKKAEIAQELNSELELISKTLPRFAKGYCLWFQRKWIINQLFIRSWLDDNQLNIELDLCFKFLKLDSRNFHCWHYRIFLCSLKSELSKMLGNREQEIHDINQNFSEQLINLNLSNYSAWFLRTTLPNTLLEIESELSWVRQGLFTEPEDQSLWQYYDWLIFNRNTNDIKPIHCLIESSLRYFIITFSKPCKIMEESSSVILYSLFRAFELEGSWEPLHKQDYSLSSNTRIKLPRQSLDPIWTFHIKSISSIKNESCIFCSNGHWDILYDIYYKTNIITAPNINPKNLKFKTSWINPDNINLKLSGTSLFNYNSLNQTVFPDIHHFTWNTGFKVTPKIIKDEISILQELLELEPGCKFALLTIAKMNSLFEEFETRNYELLSDIDPIRKPYYQEKLLESLLSNQIIKGDVKFDSQNLHLVNLLLSKLGYYVKKIDLSDCQLTSNNLDSLQLFMAPCLEELYLSKNSFSNFPSILSFMSNFSQLHILDLSDNPFSMLDDSINSQPSIDRKFQRISKIRISNCPLVSQLIDEPNLFLKQFQIEYNAEKNFVTLSPLCY